jgi:hypothetical protein
VDVRPGDGEAALARLVAAGADLSPGVAPAGTELATTGVALAPTGAVLATHAGTGAAEPVA